MGPIHTDDVEVERVERGDVRYERRRLGAAAGAVEVGLSRFAVPPGARQMPVHVHADEEEIFFVLAGDGLSWQDGAAHRVSAGDAIVHRAGAESHTLIAGEAGIDVLAFASGSATNLTWLPRAQAMWAGPRWIPVDGPSPHRREQEAGPLEVPQPADARPANIVGLGDVEHEPERAGRTAMTGRDLGRPAGSRLSGLQHEAIEPGSEGYPPHCHSAEEELFVVLDGSGTLLLGDEQHAVRPGSLVARPPGTGIAHAFRAGDDGLALLAFGTREPNDIVYYPRSGNVSLRGIKAMFRVQQVDPWDGEPL
jgi:uncharacterized cupin superfamily protein